jgi:hypothetical protein
MNHRKVENRSYRGMLQSGDGIKQQIDEMVRMNRAPEWIRDNILITDDPQEVIDAYRRILQLR